MIRTADRPLAIFAPVGVVVFILLLGAGCDQRTPEGTAAAGRSPSSLRCSVWQREASFADSVARQDAAAFAEHLADGAVFINGEPPHLHGPAEILEGWAPIISGEGLILRWHPEFVAIAGDGRTALSRGPFTMERPDLNPEARFRIGTFQSVWTLAVDGRWQVVFDGGGPTPKPATEAEVRALEASWPRDCPYA